MRWFSHLLYHLPESITTFFFLSLTYYFKILFSNFSVSYISLWKTLSWHAYLKTGKGVLKGDSGIGGVSQWIRTLAMIKRKFEFKFLVSVWKKNKPSVAEYNCNPIVEWKQADHWNVLASLDSFRFSETLSKRKTPVPLLTSYCAYIHTLRDICVFAWDKLYYPCLSFWLHHLI